MLQVICEVVEQKSLFLTFFHVLNHAYVEVHHEGMNFAGFPVFPQPSGNVKQYCLKNRRLKSQCVFNLVYGFQQHSLCFSNFNAEYYKWRNSKLCQFQLSASNCWGSFQRTNFYALLNLALLTNFRVLYNCFQKRAGQRRFRQSNQPGSVTRQFIILII